MYGLSTLSRGREVDFRGIVPGGPVAARTGRSVGPAPTGGRGVGRGRDGSVGRVTATTTPRIIDLDSAEDGDAAVFLDAAKLLFAR